MARERIAIRATKDSGLLDNVKLGFGNEPDVPDVAMYWDGTNLQVIPQTDDTGAIIFGSASKSQDVKFFLGAADKYIEFNRGTGKVTFAGIDVDISADLTITLEDLRVTGPIYADPAATQYGLKIHTHLNSTEWANEFKGEFVSTSGTMDGIAAHYHLAGTGTGIMRAVLGVAYLDAGYSMTGTDFNTQSWLAGGVFVADAGGVTNGAGVCVIGLYGGISSCNGGTLTAAKYVAGVWGASNREVVLSSGISAIFLGTVGTGALAAQVDYGLFLVSADKVTTGIGFDGKYGKVIDFAGVHPNHGDADDAYIAIGTWNDAIVISNQAYHFVPIQVHLHANTDVAADIAAARLRVDTAVDSTLNAVQVLQIRSSIGHNVKSAAAFGAGMSIDRAMTTGDGEVVCGGFSIAGAYQVSSTGTNLCTVLQATNWNTYAGVSVNHIAHFFQNGGSASIVDDLLKLEVQTGTATAGLVITRTAGTLTTGISLVGTMTTGISIPSTCTTGIVNAAMTVLNGGLRIGTVTSSIEIGEWSESVTDPENAGLHLGTRVGGSRRTRGFVVACNDGKLDPVDRIEASCHTLMQSVDWATAWSATALEGVFYGGFDLIATEDGCNISGCGGWVYLNDESGYGTAGTAPVVGSDAGGKPMYVCGLESWVAIPDDIHVDATGVICGLKLSNDFESGASPGDGLFAAIYIETADTRGYDYMIATNSASNGFVANVHAITLTATAFHMLIKIGNTDYYIPVFDNHEWA